MTEEGEIVSVTDVDQYPDFLKCIICHELFKDPVTLRCGHTFCAHCVYNDVTRDQHILDGDRHTDEDQHTNDIKTLTCPLCGQETRVSETDESTEERTDETNTSLFISRLAGEYTSDNNAEDICGLCEDDGETIPACVWCSDCGYALCADCHKVHKKLESSHTTCDIADKTARTILPKCRKHKDSTIDLMCEDCEVAVCQRCCILEHRGCRKVTPLEESTVRMDPLLEQYLKDLGNDLPSMEFRLSRCKTKIEDITRNVDSVEEAIDETCDELVAEIREQQTQLKEKLGRIREETLHHLHEEVKYGEMRVQDAKQRIGLAQEALNSDSAIDHYEVYKIFSTIRVSGNQSRVTGNVESDNGMRVSFINNRDALMASLQKRRIGYLKGLSENKEADKGKRKIDTRFADLYAITVLTWEGTKILVVTHPEEKLVQSFYTKLDKELSCSVKMDSQVYGITQIETTKAAVTVPKKKQIAILRVEPKLERDSTIKTQLRYTGLTCLTPTTLAASGEESGFIEVIDLSGARLRSFGADIFSSHLYLGTTLASNVLVSDVEQKRLLCVSEEGDVQFVYDPHDSEILDTPMGVGQGARGDVFLVDRGHHRVIQIDQTGQYVRDFVTFADEIWDPGCIHIDSDNVMYVSVDDRFVHVHEIRDS